MSSAAPHSYADLLTAVQSTLNTGLKDYNFRDGVFTSQLTATNTPVDILRTLTSSLTLTSAEKNKLRPLLSTLILLAPTEFTATRHEIYAKLTASILKPDGTPGHVLKAVQTLLEDDAKKRGLFHTPTTAQATTLKTGEVLFTHAVNAKMNLAVLPQGKASGKENSSLGSVPRFDAAEAARVEHLGTVGVQQPQPQPQHGQLSLQPSMQKADKE